MIRTGSRVGGLFVVARPAPRDTDRGAGQRATGTATTSQSHHTAHDGKIVKGNGLDEMQQLKFFMHIMVALR